MRSIHPHEWQKPGLWGATAARLAWGIIPHTKCMPKPVQILADTHRTTQKSNTLKIVHTCPWGVSRHSLARTCPRCRGRSSCQTCDRHKASTRATPREGHPTPRACVRVRVLLAAVRIVFNNNNRDIVRRGSAVVRLQHLESVVTRVPRQPVMSWKGMMVTEVIVST